VSSGTVGQVANTLWDLREQDPALARLNVRDFSRLLAAAVAHDVTTRPDYDPEDDAQVAWVREVLAARRRGDARPRGRDEHEACTEVKLGKLKLFEPCGKDRAAGD
jgi:hypothetical protein